MGGGAGFFRHVLVFLWQFALFYAYRYFFFLALFGGVGEEQEAFS